MPALPSSVAPRGIQTRPTDEGEGKGDEIFWLSAQESDIPPVVPPPSNGAAEGLAPSEPAQLAAVCEGSTGLMPGVAISVEPSGMPVGRVDPAASGDVPRMPTVGDMFNDAACANAVAGDSHAIPAVNDAQSIADTIRRDPD